MAEASKAPNQHKAPPKWLRILIPAVLIIVWFAAAGLGGPYFGRIEEVSSVDTTDYLPKSSDSAKVQEKLSEFRSDNAIPVIAVFEAKQGKLDQSTIDSIETASQKLEGIEGVIDEVSPPILSEDKQAAFVTANIDSDKDVKEVLDEAKSSLDESNISNTENYLSGPAGFSRDLNIAFSGIDGLLLIVALSVVFVILVIVYRSPLLPILVLMTSLFALAASILVVWQLANNGIVQINGQVQGILFILVIGAATDYSLLYVSRFREELHRHKTTWRATIASLKGATEPILASGGTVIVGLLCLLLSDLGSNKALGPVGSIGIALAMLSALTLLPALLLALGRSSFWPFRPQFTEDYHATTQAMDRRGFWPWLGRKVQRYPRPIWIVTLLVLVVAASGIFQLKASGVPQSEFILGYSEAREGQNVLNQHFPDGSGSPTFIVGDVTKFEETLDAIESVEGTDSVSLAANDSPSNLEPVGREEVRIKDEIRTEVEKEVAKSRADIDKQVTAYEQAYGPAAAAQFEKSVKSKIPTVEELVEKAYPFKDATPKVVDQEILYSVTLTDAPDTTAAEETIINLRSAVAEADPSAVVGGVTATSLDTNNTSIRDREVIIPVVLIAITLILMVLLRSLVAPILLLLTTVISFGTALGVAAWLFNGLLGLQGADPSVPLYAFVFLVALGIDYNIFLMTRVREESIKYDPRTGIIKGLVVTGGVITSAGIVLAATFAALAVIPILFLAQLAFIVSFGVLLDTIIVRSLLVPALIYDLGPNVWWPSKLAKKPSPKE